MIFFPRKSNWILLILLLFFLNNSFYSQDIVKHESLIDSFCVNPFMVDYSVPLEIEGYMLIWHEEFNYEGEPDINNWGYEHGFVRNRELQWYQPRNTSCKDGRLIIEAKRERIGNPNYDPNSGDWRLNRPQANYSSACITTRDKHEWSSFGYFEIRARIDTSLGAWPAIWMLGSEKSWPACGEIDIMEFYRVKNEASLLANVAWDSEIRWSPNWDTSITPLKDFLIGDPDWVFKYHVWSMEWNKECIRLFVDGRLLNETRLEETVNPDGDNPFDEGKKHYLLINLAIGSNGGDPSFTTFPVTFEVDYIRVYKPSKD